MAAEAARTAGGGFAKGERPPRAERGQRGNGEALTKSPTRDDLLRLMAYWAAVKTIGQRESFAAEAVAVRGFEIFLPRVRALVGVKWKTGPLFPGYIFVRVVDRWRLLERTMRVISVVKTGETPAKCPDAEIGALLERSDPDGIIRLSARPAPQIVRRAFAPGEAVTVTGGAFRGFSGLHSGMSVRDREIVLLDVLGGQRPVEIASDLVAPKEARS